MSMIPGACPLGKVFAKRGRKLAASGKDIRLSPLLLAVLLLTLLSAGPVLSQNPQSPPGKAGEEVQVVGKLFCSLKRPVILPFAGEITQLSVKPGQAVTAGQVLASYRLHPEAALALRRRLAPPQIRELELRLAQLDRELAALQAKHHGTRTLAQENLASRQSLTQVEGELQALKRSRAAVMQSLAQEQRLAQEDQKVLTEQLGLTPPSGRPPAGGLLRAPIDGHVVWMHADLRPGAELKGGEVVMQVGVLDPMMLLARVHEREATLLKPEAEARVQVESLPGRTFTARLARLPWSAQTPALDQPSYFEVEFRLANPELLLKEGLKATLFLERAPR